MKRVCVIDVAGLSLRSLSASGDGWLSSLTFGPKPLRTVFPSVPPTVQASMTTGVGPGVHGIIGGGLFRRQSRRLGLDDRSNTLLNKKRFWHSRHLPARPTVAMLFCYHPLAGGADVVVGVSSYGASCGHVVSQPVSVGRSLSEKLGRAEARGIRGPAADWRAGEWIASAACELLRDRKPDLMWVHLPGAQFEMIRHGPDSSRAAEAVAGVLGLSGRIAECVGELGGETVVVGGGGYLAVSNVGRPNERLRRAGLLEFVDTPDGLVPDLDRSRAIAMVDHQVAHLFCEDESVAADAAEAVAEDPAVESVRPRDELFEPGLGHDRAGERIAVARPDAWLAYPWWDAEDRPPREAARPDFAGRCGYDPCELFPGRSPGDIDPDPSRVRACRGRDDIEAADDCVIAATGDVPLRGERPGVTEVAAALKRVMFE